MTTFAAFALTLAAAFACGLVLSGIVGFTLNPRTRCFPTNEEI